MSERDRHILAGDLGWLEYAIADYVARWGEHFTGEPYLDEFGGPNIAGIPTAVANMAMTVIRKNLVTASREQLIEAMTDWYLAHWNYDYDPDVAASARPTAVAHVETALAAYDDAMEQLADVAPVVAGEPESAPAEETRPVCSTCAGKGLVSYSGRGEDGPDPCTTCGPPDQPEEKLVDLMGALETSVREAKEARARHPQPLIPVENWVSADDEEAPRG